MEKYESNVVTSVDDNEEETLETTTRTIYALSTLDNPFNPFDNFNEWLMFDMANEYFCCEYLARIVNETDDMSELEKIQETERAIDEILEHNPNPIYIKVSKEVELY